MALRIYRDLNIYTLVNMGKGNHALALCQLASQGTPFEREAALVESPPR